MLTIEATIAGLSYQPLLCKSLEEIPFAQIHEGMQKRGSFLLKMDEINTVAMSWWVSAKRTRSYPYARVYDTLNFCGKKVTVIPVYKDEGCDGERDYIQWDTISLMSLLGVYVILSYYQSAMKSKRFRNKITKQRFDTHQISSELRQLIGYQSDALHWNIQQSQKVNEIGEKAISAYQDISQKTGVRMSSPEEAQKRFAAIAGDSQKFIDFSRNLAMSAQDSESRTNQPKESLTVGRKAKLTIRNYLGGEYYLTVDEAFVKGEVVFISEGKHSKIKPLPSKEDIKDGLLKMMLYTNLNDVRVDGKRYRPVPILKLTSSNRKADDLSSAKTVKFLENLKQEAELNHFLLQFD